MRELAQQKESEVEEGDLMAGHVHMMLSIPPKYSVSGVVGYIKGRSAIAIARRFMDRTKNFVGLNFWARGYYVSTVGRDESQVGQDIREQEKEDRRRDQLKMFEYHACRRSRPNRFERSTNQASGFAGGT